MGASLPPSLGYTVCTRQIWVLTSLPVFLWHKKADKGKRRLSSRDPSNVTHAGCFTAHGPGGGQLALASLSSVT